MNNEKKLIKNHWQIARENKLEKTKRDISRKQYKEKER